MSGEAAQAFGDGRMDGAGTGLARLHGNHTYALNREALSQQSQTVWVRDPSEGAEGRAGWRQDES